MVNGVFLKHINMMGLLKEVLPG